MSTPELTLQMSEVSEGRRNMELESIITSRILIASLFSLISNSHFTYEYLVNSSDLSIKELELDNTLLEIKYKLYFCNCFFR